MDDLYSVDDLHKADAGRTVACGRTLDSTGRPAPVGRRRSADVPRDRVRTDQRMRAATPVARLRTHRAYHAPLVRPIKKVRTVV